MSFPSARHWALCLLFALGASSAAWSADAPAGIVKRVAGTVQLQRGDSTMGVVVGLPVQVGDVLRTGRDATVSVTLADDTLLAAGADSELVITQFAFDPTTQDGGMLLSLWRGVLSVVSGLVAKKAPEKVNVQTRTIVLGVRGTEFIVDAGEVRP